MHCEDVQYPHSKTMFPNKKSEHKSCTELATDIWFVHPSVSLKTNVTCVPFSTPMDSRFESCSSENIVLSVIGLRGRRLSC